MKKATLSLIITLIIFPNIYILGKPSQLKSAENTHILEWVREAKAIPDAITSIKSKDYRLYAIYQYTLVFPGIDEKNHDLPYKYGYRIIEGTSDVIDNPLQIKAITYAKKYNETILKHIATKKDVKLENPIKQTPGYCLKNSTYGKDIEWAGLVVSANIRKVENHALIDWLVEHRYTKSKYEDKKYIISDKGDGYFIIHINIEDPKNTVVQMVNNIVRKKYYAFIKGTPINSQVIMGHQTISTLTKYFKMTEDVILYE
jgi:hypothetical protein